MCCSNAKKIILWVKRASGVLSTHMRNKIGALVLLALSLCCSGCFEMGEQYEKIPPGVWRGVLKLDASKDLITSVPRETRRGDDVFIESVVEGELPFLFEVIYDTPEEFYIEVLNGAERIRLDEIVYGRDQATNKDTLTIYFNPYDSYLNVIFEDNIMEGYWHEPSRGDDYRIHFVARHGQSHRFTHLRKEPAGDLTGRWEVTFDGYDDVGPENAIGVFEQRGNHLTGTFMTATGDYRYLEGTVQANKMYLSCFDGGHSFLFEAVIEPGGTLSGVFRSGIHHLNTWTGRRNSEVSLPNALALTSAKTGRFELALPDVDGDTITLDHLEYANKRKLIQVMGTWCPNCSDQTAFLTDYLSRKSIDVAVVAVAFERHKDSASARQAIKRYQTKMGVPWRILYGGTHVKKEAAKALTSLNEVVAYPTLILLNQQNEIMQIYTGFQGPATAEYDGFEQMLDSWLNL